MRKVSIIVRTKDRILLLERAIKSILSQTFTDWEIILINNGKYISEIKKIIDKYRSKLNDRLVLINKIDEIGMDSLINYGIEKSESEYITLLDDDDTWNNNFLEECISFLETNKQYDGIVTQTNLIYEKIEDNKITEISKNIFNARLKKLNTVKMARCNRFTTNSFLYRRNSLGKTGIYRTDLPVLGDWEFNIRFILNGYIYVIPKPLANYHKRKIESDIQSYNNSNIDIHLYYDKKLRKEYLYAGLRGHNFLFGILAYCFGYINYIVRTLKKLKSYNKH